MITMIICFNCNKETKVLLDSLLSTGHYTDYAEAISFAVMNLSVLQERILKKGGLVIADDELITVNSRRKKSVTTKSVLQGTDSDKQNHESEQVNTSAEVPEIFLLNGLSESSLTYIDLPFDMWVKGQGIPLDRWVFGQYNKLLPAKASCRALAHLLNGKPKGVLREDATRIVAEKATDLGDFLRNHDEQHDVGRDEALSTAFPSTDKEIEK